ncbi:MAG TPA: ABC transporter ATP-binding protein [Mycobacteriales bacterium]|nr:ABC transporter ATP-binding protein [Mycobacteriales bacterium]
MVQSLAVPATAHATVAADVISATSQLALDVRSVTKDFGPPLLRRIARRTSTPYRAVNDVSFAVPAGEIFGVIGANGSGKSTLIRILSTLLLPDGGDVHVFGRNVVTQALEVRRLINRVSADPSFFRPMSAVENLLFFGRAYGLTGEETRRESLSLLEQLGLDERRAREPMLKMSRGQQQKVAVARAFLTKPRLLLLDEPTTGLDPRSKRDVQRFVSDIRRDHGVTILLTTHDMEEAELLCDRIAFLAEGRIVAEGTPLQLRERIADGRAVEDVDMEDVFMTFTGRRLDEDEEGNPDDNG